MDHINVYERFYQPNSEIKQRLDLLVKELREKYHGGRTFFNALDSAIKSEFNEDLILQLVKGNPNEYIVSSGEFGRKVYKMWKEGKFNCKGMLIFNGKMSTLSIGVTNYFPSKFDLNNKDFIYIDDSYFSGQTVQNISEFLSSFNSRIKYVSVIYDGSKIKKKNVRSFFRYYDNFDKNEGIISSFKSFFNSTKSKDPKQKHELVILNLKKIVDSECSTELELRQNHVLIKVNDIEVKDYCGKEASDFSSGPPNFSSYSDSIIVNDISMSEKKPFDSRILGTVIIKLIQDESNLVVIAISYNNSYRFDMLTWKELIIRNNRSTTWYLSPMLGTEILCDKIYKYFDEKGLFGDII